MRCVLYFTLGILYLTNYSIRGQNLINNPSFEDYKKCPNTLGTFNLNVTSWSCPTEGSTDYFNTCSTVMSAPENFNGIQHTKEGSAYAGLYFYAPSDYREYIQVKLKKKLRANKKYQLSFYLSLAEGSDFAVKDFGIICSYKKIKIKTKKELSKGRLYSIKGNKFHTFEINHPKFHKNKSDWIKVTTSFIAKGYEQYLLIGNLRNNKLTRKVLTSKNKTKKGAYYYIDQVNLQNEETTQELAYKETFELNKKHHFKNVLFNFDVFDLNEEAKKSIKKIYNFLVDFKEINITILGHTDDEGSQVYNKNLSIKRAKTIANLLISMGLPKERVTYKGFGSKMPITSNNTDAGRKRNRRVEFILNKN